MANPKNGKQNPAEQTGQVVLDEAKKIGRKAQKKVTGSIKKQTRKVARRATQRMAETTKKAIRKARKVAAKAAKAVIKAGIKMVKVVIQLIIKLIVALFPWSIIVIIIVIIIAFAVTLMDGKGKTQSYQQEDPSYDNSLVEEGDYYVNDGLSYENKLVLAFYTYFANMSYKVLVEDNTHLYNYNDSYLVNNTIQDKYGREKYFKLSPAMLCTLDSELNDGRYLFPEQFIQTVYYDEDTYELKSLVDDKGNVVAESTAYNSSGQATSEKTTGIWDYGFGSILHYKEFEEYEKTVGYVTSREVYDSTTGTVVTESYIDEDDTYEKMLDTSVAYLIDWALTPSGKISNNIVFEEVRSSADWEIQIYNGRTYDEVVACPELTEEQKAEMSEEEIILYEEQTCYETHRLMDTYTVHKVQKIATYEGEPDLSNLVGCQYYKDYFANYEAYIPETVMTSFDYSGRTGLTETALLELLADDDASGSVSIGDNNGIVSSTVELSIGSSKGSSNIKNATQYLAYFMKYGEMYGVDPYLLIAKAAQESGGVHNPTYNSSGGTGIMQIEYVNAPGGVGTFTAYNFLTQSMESVSLNITKVEENIRAGTMMFANNVDKFNGNLLMALQGYNYGSGGVKALVTKYAEDSGKTYSQVEGDSSDTGWISYILDLHLNPKAYGVTGYSGTCNMATCPYSGSTHPSGYKFGDPSYLSNVLRYYADPSGGSPWAKTSEGTVYVLGDLSSVQVGTSSMTTTVTTSKKKNFLQKLWNMITTLVDNFSDLFPDHPAYEGVRRVKYSNHIFQPVDQNNILATILAMEEGEFISSYGIITDEYWIERYSYLFSNSVMVTANDVSVYDAIAMKYFPNGFTQPLSDCTDVVKGYGISDGGEPHSGVDFGATTGTKVVAISDGRVTSVTGSDTNGYTVKIKHDDDIVSVYSNLSSATVSIGKNVSQGQIIGYTGQGYETYEDGASLTGLHFGLQSSDGTAMDCTFIYKSSGSYQSITLYEGASEQGAAILSTAYTFAGGWYLWGGGHSAHESTYSAGDDFDCSGFVSVVLYNAIGLSMTDLMGDNTTNGYHALLKKYDGVKCDVFDDFDSLLPGDVIIFYDGNPSQNDPSHVAIFAYKSDNGLYHTVEAKGKGKIIGEYEHSKTSLTNRYVRFIRIRPTGTF